MFNRNRSWLMQLLKSGKSSPQSRLLKIFDVLLSPTSYSRHEIEQEFVQQKTRLIRFLHKQAKASGARLPDTLAQQIIIVLDNALQQEKQQPESQALRHARTATEALIRAQCVGSWRRLRDLSANASFVSLLGITLFVSWYMLREPPVVRAPAASYQLWNTSSQETPPSPQHVAALYNALERMRQGTCQFPQALMLGSSERSVFLNNIVNGRLSNRAEDIALATQLLKKVSCEYRPLITLPESEQTFIKTQLTLPVPSGTSPNI